MEQISDELNATKLACEQVQRLLLEQRTADWHWEGELSASALSTATAVSAFSYYLQSEPDSHLSPQLKTQVESGLNWLMARQNADGGWGDTDLNYSNISTSMLVIAAIHAAQATERCGEILDAANRYVEGLGGTEAVRKRYGEDKTFAVPILANCAMSGIVDWKEVGTLPFEAACVPQRFYHLLNLPVVSYAVPALVAIGQAKFHFDPPRNPLMRWIRKMSVERSLNVLLKMQPESGGFLEAIPLTSFVCMALIKTGRHDHPVVQRGVNFLLESFRLEPGAQSQGTWPIDTNLATWVTTLSINALSADPTFEFENQDQWSACLDWILDCQYQNVHPFTGSPPGGWGWTNLTGSVPDADDTPGALLALHALRERTNVSAVQQARIKQAAEDGIRWLLDLQNRDGGWPTFCRGWGRLPFDRSGTDITAHVIRALDVWNSESSHKKKIRTATERGFNFLGKNQYADGSWLPLWFGNQDQVDDINPFYGTVKVVHAYHQCDRLHTKVARNGLEWMLRNQNRDGGWGGGDSISYAADDSGETGMIGESSVEETALCTHTLLLINRDDGDQQQDSLHDSCQIAADKGVRWLRTAAENGLVGQCSPIGFYFAKLWYFEKLYPLIYAASALGLGAVAITTDDSSSGV